MKKRRPLVSVRLKPLTPAQRKVLDRFAEKSESAMPEIVKIVERRRTLASKSRRSALKR